MSAISDCLKSGLMHTTALSIVHDSRGIEYDSRAFVFTAEQVNDDCSANTITAALVEAEIDRVLTQYRESPHLLGLLRAYLNQVSDVLRAIYMTPPQFDINASTGDQLTLIGKRLGFPREHCVCVVSQDDGAPREAGTSVVTIDDDEVYRGILLARRYQALGLYDIDSLTAAARHIWGGDAWVHSLGGARVAVVPHRSLLPYERALRSVAFRSLPIAPGVTALTSEASGLVFGFGAGWGGFCEGAEWLCPIDPNIYDCPQVTDG